MADSRRFPAHGRRRPDRAAFALSPEQHDRKGLSPGQRLYVHMVAGASAGCLTCRSVIQVFKPQRYRQFEPLGPPPEYLSLLPAHAAPAAGFVPGNEQHRADIEQAERSELRAADGPPDAHRCRRQLYIDRYLRWRAVRDGLAALPGRSGGFPTVYGSQPLLQPQNTATEPPGAGNVCSDERGDVRGTDRAENREGAGSGASLRAQSQEADHDN